MYYIIYMHMNKSRTIFDKNIFDTIDTEEKAYWLGFIYADGNISSHKEGVKKRYSFELSLSNNDINHLKKFKEFIKSNKELKVSTAGNLYKYLRCRICISNKHLWNVLNSYGCVPKKSLTLKFPKISIFFSKDLIRHFIRGYFDGDGCISYNNKSHTEMSISLLGTKDFLEELQRNLPLEKENKIYKEKNKKVYQLSFQRSRGIYILNYLYKDAKIYLDRKYKRYKEYCRLY